MLSEAKSAGGGTKYEFGKSILENLKAMSVQKSLAEVAAGCDIAFCRYSKEIEGLKVINASDPLRAAIDFAAEHNKTCLVHEHDWFGVVPPRQHDMRRWLNCLRLWESIDEPRRIKASKVKKC
ncbi:hypothetical protein KA005_27320 [bacterium]|nr:hypothetical protein [bacterium]